MKKILLAFDSFKGSLTSLEAARAAARAVADVLPAMPCEIIPVADGGEGTVDAVVTALDGRRVSATVTGPLGRPVSAGYGVCGPTAVIEMAAASGLPLVPADRRNPLITTSRGTGELILDALSRGCRRFLIGLGGSATNDAGVGMLAALGFRFLDADGREVGRGGGEVGRIVTIDDSAVVPAVRESVFTVACDVTNPLTGPAGASRVYGPQKGADPAMVDRLDAALGSFGRVVAAHTGHDHSATPGAGAAGGLGFAFLAFLGGRLEPGVDMVLDAAGFDAKLADASLVITGEGRLDPQTINGKAPFGVLRRAAAAGVPVVAVGGSVDPDAVNTLLAAGFRDVVAASDPAVPLTDSMSPSVAAANVTRAVARVLPSLNI